MTKRHLLTILLLFSSLSLFADDEITEPVPSPARSGVRWSLGLGVISSPRPYVGANNSILPIPLVELYYKKFYVQGIQAGFHLFENGDFVIDARAGIVFAGLDPNDSPDLEGLTERKSSIEGGVVVDWTPGKFKLSASAYTDLLGRSDGQQIGLDLSRAWTFNDYRWGLTPSIGFVWQSGNFVDYYVGVTPGEAAPGRPAYEPGSAVNFRSSLFVYFMISHRVTAVGLLRVQRLDNEIYSSPIVDKQRAYFGLVGITYKFGKLQTGP